MTQYNRLKSRQNNRDQEDRGEKKEAKASVMFYRVKRQKNKEGRYSSVVIMHVGLL